MNKETMNGCGPVDGTDTGSRRILEAVAYLGQCVRLGSTFAVLTGHSRADSELALRRFAIALPSATRLARILAPTDSSHAFLEAILAQLGFEPFESTADDLQRLLNVVLRQGATQKTRTIILIEDAQEFGPRVFETLRELARNSREFSPPPLLVMAGHAGLNRVLDSQGMSSVAQLTRLRFDFDAPRDDDEQTDADEALAAEPPPAAKADAVPLLVLSKDDEVLRRLPVDRDRMLIGRSPYADICIASRYVSRQHALLLRNADGDWLIDLKSTNGTSVNSKLVQQRRLEHGDIVSIGNHQLRYDNPAGRPDAIAVKPSRDQLSETMVMRSLQALRAVRDDSADQADSAPTAA